MFKKNQKSTRRTLGCEELQARQLMAADLGVHVADGLEATVAQEDTTEKVAAIDAKSLQQASQRSNDLDRFFKAEFTNNNGYVSINGSIVHDETTIEDDGRFIRIRNVATDYNGVEHISSARYVKEVVNSIMYFGKQGDDVLRNNTALNTYADGGKGNDTLVGGTGTNNLYGGEDNDSLYGNVRNDVLDGQSGNDRLIGNGGRDRLSGGIGHDYLSGGDGNDSMFGGEGNDTMYGGRHDDTMAGGTGNDTLSGGSGHDKIYGNYYWDLELKAGEQDNDRIYGGSGDDILKGNAGHDLIFGHSGNDKIWGGDHLDTIYGGDNDDMLNGGNDGYQDRLIGGRGADEFVRYVNWSPFTPDDPDSFRDYNSSEDDIDYNDEWGYEF